MTQLPTFKHFVTLMTLMKIISLMMTIMMKMTMMTIIISSCGGNLLMNIGPSSDGSIEPIFQERLRQVFCRLIVNPSYQEHPNILKGKYLICNASTSLTIEPILQEGLGQFFFFFFSAYLNIQGVFFHWASP